MLHSSLKDFVKSAVEFDPGSCMRSQCVTGGSVTS